MIPSCDQTGVPIHFHSSTTSGSASLMSLRILPRVFPRQSPSSAILFAMSSDADWPWLAPDFFTVSSSTRPLDHPLNLPAEPEVIERKRAAAGRRKEQRDQTPERGIFHAELVPEIPVIARVNVRRTEEEDEDEQGRGP